MRGETCASRSRKGSSPWWHRHGQRPRRSRSRIVRGDTYFVPLGGSNALGSLGFVDAANEIAGQVAAGVMPEPDVVVVAMGSGGTAAGLAVGFEAAGMRTRVVGVAISQPVPVLSAMARRWRRRRPSAPASRALRRRAR